MVVVVVVVGVVLLAEVAIRMGSANKEVMKSSSTLPPRMYRLPPLYVNTLSLTSQQALTILLLVTSLFLLTPSTPSIAMLIMPKRHIHLFPTSQATSRLTLAPHQPPPTRTLFLLLLLHPPNPLRPHRPTKCSNTRVTDLWFTACFTCRIKRELCRCFLILVIKKN